MMIGILKQQRKGGGGMNVRVILIPALILSNTGSCVMCNLNFTTHQVSTRNLMLHICQLLSDSEIT